MATRVNTKFVALLSVIIVAIVAAVAVFYTMVVMADPAQLRAQGDELMERGNVEAALIKYREALGARSNEADLILTYVSALRQKRVSPGLKARQANGQIIAWTEKATTLRPNDDELLARYYNLLLTNAQRFGSSSGYYERLYTQANEKLRNQPQNLVAHKFRGIAQVHRLNPTMDEQDQQQAKADLEKALQANAKDPEAIYHLGRWHLYQAEQAQLKNNVERADTMREKALKISETLVTDKLSSTTSERLIKRAQLLLHEQLRQVEMARPVLKTLETRLLKDPTSSDRLLSLVQLLPRLALPQADANTNTVERATDASLKRMQRLLERGVEAHPKQVMFHLMLGRVLRQRGNQDEAIAAYEKAMNTEIVGEPGQVVRSAGMRRLAERELPVLLLNKARQTDDPEQRKQLLDRTEAIADKIEQRRTGGTSGIVNRLRGELALHRGNPGRAAKKLEEAMTQLNDVSPRLRYLTAQAYLRDGAWGEAANQLEQLNESFEGLQSLRLRLARIYLEHQQLNKAARHINAVLEKQPGHGGAVELKARLLASRGDHASAIELYTQLVEKNSQLAPELARLYITIDQRDKAKQVLRQRLKQSPDDLSALRLLLAVTEDKTQQQQLIQNAAEAGADEQLVSLLRSAIEAQGQSSDRQRELRQQVLDRLIAQQDNAVEQAIMRARIALQQGNVEQAQEMLDSAAEEDADHPGLIRLRFNLALTQDPSSEQAGELAAKAASMDLDNANGQFFRGRLALARNNVASAVEALRQGLTIKPVDPQGQRLLGDALRRSGDLDGAASAYQRAINQQPSNVEALQRLAMVELQRGQPRQALSHLRTARRFKPDDAELQEMYLRVEQQYGDPAQALQRRLALAEQNPQNLANRRQIIELYSQTGQHDQAIQRAKALIEENGESRANIALLAQAYRAAGQGAQGTQRIQAYLDSQGEQVGARDYMLLARYELARGQGDAAMAAYNKAIELEDPEEAVASRELAQIFFQRGMSERAAKLYKKLYERNPESHAIGHRWVESLLRMNQTDKAEQALSDMPASATKLALQGIVAMQRGDEGQAFDMLSDSLEEEPDQPFVLFQRARLRLRQDNQLEAARNDLTRAIELAPDLHPARFAVARTHLRMNNVQAAIGQLRQLLSRNPGHTQGRLQLARIYQSEGQPTSARQVLEQGRQQFPDQSLWSRELAQLEATEDNPEAALAAWRQAVDAEPSAENLRGLSQQLLRTDQPQQADALLTEHVGVMNQSPRLQGIRAQALAQLGQPEQALNLFRVALKKVTSPATVNKIAGRMRAAWSADRVVDELASLAPQMERPELGSFAQAGILISNNRFSAAMEQLEPLARELSVEEDLNLWASVRQMQGICLQKVGRFEAARRTYNAVLEHRPDNVSTLNNLAYLLVDRFDEPQRALELAQRAIEQEPNNASLLDTLGWAQFKTNQVYEARETLSRSIELGPLPENYLHLARVLMALENPSRARSLLKQAVELANQNQVPEIAEQANQLLSELAKN
jgi:tetratricopeptide (TPR) repeat protein